MLVDFKRLSFSSELAASNRPGFAHTTIIRGCLLGDCSYVQERGFCDLEELSTLDAEHNVRGNNNTIDKALIFLLQSDVEESGTKDSVGHLCHGFEGLDFQGAFQ